MTEGVIMNRCEDAPCCGCCGYAKYRADAADDRDREERDYYRDDQVW